MIYTITRYETNYLNIAGRTPAVNTSNSNFAEVDTFKYIYEANTDGYIGIEHSRRFFGHEKPVAEIGIKSLLEKYKAIVCPYYMLGNNIGLFRNSHRSNALDEALSRTLSEHPEMSSAIAMLSSGNFMTLHNMIYTTKEIFGEYIKFLEDTLYKYNLTDANDEKLNAHLAERYQTLFLLHNFKLSELCFANVTCYSKDLTKIVNSIDGLDRT